MARQWYVRNGKKTSGPLSTDQLRWAAMTGLLLPNAEISADQKQWHPAAKVKGLEFGSSSPSTALEDNPPAPPPLPPRASTSAAPAWIPGKDVPEPNTITVETATPAVLPRIKEVERFFNLATGTAVAATILSLRLLFSESRFGELMELIFGLVSLATWLIFHWYAWSSIPPAVRETTPSRAVGFLLIPFYNCYWVFKSCGGLSRGLKSALNQYGIEAPKVIPEMAIGYSVTFALLWVVSVFVALTAEAETAGALPLVTLIEIASFVAWMLMVTNQKEAVEYILEQEGKAGR